MENNKDVLKFQFPDNYLEIIKDSSIVGDFDKFIELAINGQLELSKTNTLSASAAKLINKTITRKIPMQMARPVLRSFPNVLALFILFNLSGLSKTEIKGKKKYLSVNKKMLKQWELFTDVDKYFYLFSITFSNFSFESINEGNSYLEFSFITTKLAELKKRWIPEKFELDLYFKMYKYKTIFMALNMFALLDIEDAPPIEKQGWNIVSIEPKSFMMNIWKTINDLNVACRYAVFDENGGADSNEELDFDYSFSIEDIEEIGVTSRFTDEISKVIPEFTKRLTLEMPNKTGIFQFKVSLGTVHRTLKIDSRKLLNDLCYAILNAYDFDFDHLYDIKFISTFGYKLVFNGAPEISYAKYPTTSDINIGSLPIQINDEMVFTYDYGDNWKFKITLEKFDAIKKQTKIIPDTEVINIKGKAPEQYRW